MKLTTTHVLSMPFYLHCALAAPQVSPQAGVYCTFFSDKDCKGGSSIAYSVNNDGCFSVTGKSVDCRGFEISALNPRLIQTPGVNNQNCYCQSHCSNLNLQLKTCWNLEDQGFNMDHNVWRFINDGGGCDGNNC